MKLCSAFGRRTTSAGGMYNSVLTTGYLERTSGLWAGSAITVCGWISHQISGSGFRGLVSITTTGSVEAYWLGYNGSNVPQIWSSGAGTTISGTYTSCNLFFAVTADGTTGASALVAYMRRPEEKTFSSAARVGIASDLEGIRLTNSESALGTLRCRIWDVRVWDTPLTARELMRESLSTAGPVKASNLKGWYPLSGRYASSTVSNPMLMDYSGESQHLTATSAGYTQIYSARQSSVPLKFRPVRLIGESISTRIPIWALSNSLRSRQHV